MANGIWQFIYFFAPGSLPLSEIGTESRSDARESQINIILSLFFLFFYAVIFLLLLLVLILLFGLLFH